MTDSANGDHAIDDDDDDEAGHRLDELVPAAWSDEVVASLDRWRQGDLVAGTPMFWAAPAGADPVLDIVGGEFDWQPIDLGFDRGGWVMVTSQTCDIAGAGPGARQPFVDVSPVYRLPADYNPQILDSIRSHQVTHLKELTLPPGQGTYVVDLRLSMPASKGLLVANDPVDAWASEQDRLALAEHIATRARRPALHDALSYDLTRSLGDYIKSNHKNRPEWWNHVEQLRLRIRGDRLQPAAVGLLVCCELELTDEQRAVWRGWQRHGEAILKPHGITLEPSLFQTLDQMPARLYMNSVPLRIPELRRIPAW